MKKILFFLFISIAAISYVKNHYSFGDILRYSKTHPNRSTSPAVDYYVGMTAYLKSDYDLAVPAFEQLLADYPTCQYAPNALVRLAGIHSEKYHWEPARAALQRYMDDFPQGSEIESVRRKYEFIKFK
ncbi:MAG: tetratricopeptide repeat protein [Elusimicrobiota bacterium]|jgi:TolA-binding protein